MMPLEIPLLDALSIQTDCMYYLSDLHYLDKWQRMLRGHGCFNHDHFLIGEGRTLGHSGMLPKS